MGCGNPDLTHKGEAGIQGSHLARPAGGTGAHNPLWGSKPTEGPPSGEHERRPNPLRCSPLGTLATSTGRGPLLSSSLPANRIRN